MRAFLWAVGILVVAGCASIPSAPAEETSIAAAPGAFASVEECLTEAGEDDHARQRCVGAATSACIARDDANATTAGMVLCATSERAEWQTLRARYEALLRARESATQRALFDVMAAEQERWLQARCAYQASLYEGGSLARYLGAACARDTDAELTLDLHARLFDE